MKLEEMDSADKPRHWELSEIVGRNIASYWPRQNQLFGVIGAPRNTDFSREYLFPGDKLIHLADYRMKGFPENNFRYPRIPFAVRDHFLEHKLRASDDHLHSHRDEKPDLCGSTPFDLGMDEIRHWKDLQRRNAYEDEIRKKMERQKILRLLQEEVEAERERYLTAKERLAAIEYAKAGPLPPISSSSPTQHQTQSPHPVVVEPPLNDHFPLPPIRRSWQTPREPPIEMVYQPTWKDANREPPVETFYQPTWQNTPREPPGDTVYQQSWQNTPREPPPNGDMSHHQRWAEYSGEPHYDHQMNLTPRQTHFVKEMAAEQTQTDSQIPIYPTPPSVRTTTYNRTLMQQDHKKRYLEELRQAAEARRARWRRERDESREPFTDTVTLLGADRPRYVPLNAAYHRNTTDVTRPGFFLQFH